jgi:hypothetical protein
VSAYDHTANTNIIPVFIPELQVLEIPYTEEEIGSVVNEVRRDVKEKKCRRNRSLEPRNSHDNDDVGEWMTSEEIDVTEVNHMSVTEPH